MRFALPIPRIVGRLNRVATNRATGLFARHAPGFGVVLHQGRRSGRRYRTPVNVFRVPRGYLIALTYGPDSDWVKNVLAANGCLLDVRGDRVRMVDPHVVHDESRRGVPSIVRSLLGLLNVSDFLYLTEELHEPDRD